MHFCNFGSSAKNCSGKRHGELNFSNCIYPPRKLTWNLKWWFLIGISSSRGSFSGSMLVFRGVHPEKQVEFLRILSFDPTLESYQGNSPLKNKRSNFCPPTPPKKKETASSSKFPGYKKTARVVKLVSPKAPIIVQGIPPKIPCIIITLKVGIRKKRSTVHNSLTTDLAKQGTHVFFWEKWWGESFRNLWKYFKYL